MYDSRLVESSRRVLSLAQSVPDFVWYPVSRTASHDIVCVNVQVLANLDGVSVVQCLFHAQLAPCRGEDGRNLLVVRLLGRAWSSKRVDEHLDALVALRRAICAVQQLFYPSCGNSTARLVQRIADDGGPHALFGCGLRILDSNVAVVGVFGPKNIVKGD